MSLIDRNSKLFQKFIQNKNKQVQREKERVEKTNTKAELNCNIMNDQNVNTINIQKSCTDKQGQKITDLLKQQLQRQRKKQLKADEQRSTISEIPEGKQIYELKKQIYSLKLQMDYLNNQNICLKQQLKEEQQKTHRLQQYKEKALQKQNHYSVNEFSSEKMMRMQSQINALREQNYLAKDYLYKLTLKLYQSQKHNQELQKQLANKHLDSQSITKQERKGPNEASDLQRQRQFKTSREASINKQIQQKEPVKREGGRSRIEQIKKELQQLQELKVFNGKNRRRKIQLQRQFQQLKFMI